MKKLFFLLLTFLPYATFADWVGNEDPDPNRAMSTSSMSSGEIVLSLLFILVMVVFYIAVIRSNDSK